MTDVVASRPIDVDKATLQVFVEQRLVPAIVRWLKRQPLDEPIGTVESIVTDVLYGLEEADGRYTHDVAVIVGARASTAKGAAVLAGKSSYSRGNQRGIVHLFMNGALTPNDLLVASGWTNRLQPISACRTLSCLPYGLYTVLLHEVTHNVDVFAKPIEYSHEQVEKDPVAPAYINDPSEVRAFMQEIVDQTEHAAKVIAPHVKSNQDLMDKVLLLSDTWGIIEKSLSRSNRAKILKAVYTNLERVNFLKAANMDLYSYDRTKTATGDYMQGTLAGKSLFEFDAKTLLKALLTGGKIAYGQWNVKPSVNSGTLGSMRTWDCTYVDPDGTELRLKLEQNVLYKLSGNLMNNNRTRYEVNASLFGYSGRDAAYLELIKKAVITGDYQGGPRHEANTKALQKLCGQAFGIHIARDLY